MEEDHRCNQSWIQNLSLSFARLNVDNEVACQTLENCCRRLWTNIWDDDFDHKEPREEGSDAKVVGEGPYFIVLVFLIGSPDSDIASSIR